MIGSTVGCSLIPRVKLSCLKTLGLKMLFRLTTIVKISGKLGVGQSGTEVKEVTITKKPNTMRQSNDSDNLILLS